MRRSRQRALVLTIALTTIAGVLEPLGFASAAVPTTPAPTVPSYSEVAQSAGTYPTGQYIVTLADPSAAAYQGGVSGYSRTMAATGRQLDASMPAVSKYSRFLTNRQRALASAVGATPLYSYTIAYNGFAARLTSAQAARLAKSSDVASVLPDESFAPTAGASSDSSSSDSVSAATSAQPAVSSNAVSSNAGAGIVVGDIDTGIAPENPSFAAPALSSTASSDQPWLNGSTITYAKSDGATFTSKQIPDTASGEWNASDYNQKIIAAQYFVAGFGAQKIGTPAMGEYLSPRDGSSHGSHTASTAAGNADVAAVVSGVSKGTISGVAPAAKLAIYKACWSDTNPSTTTGDTCFTSDTLAAVDRAVADGVDVINYSIGGSSETSFSVMEAAFLNAAAAGVFVAAAAGNDGPAASSVENVAPWVTTVAASDSQGAVASFSSRGPSLADGGDVLKPDVAAPGVSILAAEASAEGAAPRFGYLSGTSMATPHVAGDAALYLGGRPTATPAEVKSALLTSSGDLTGSDRPFDGGAGNAQPAASVHPGFFYPAGIADWKSFLVGTGDADDPGSSVEPTGFFDGVSAVDASNLNQPSISIGSLIGSQTITRTVTSTTAADVSYTVSASMPGISVVVAPTTLHFTGAGQTLQYTVTVRTAGAPSGAWAAGSIEWTSNESPATTVNSPIVVRPTSASVRAAVSGTGTSGSASLSVTAGFTGTIPLTVEGLAAGTVATNAADPTSPYTGMAKSTDATSDNPFPYSSVTRVDSGTTYAEFDVNPTRTVAGTDLDLEVYYAANSDALANGPFTLVGTSVTSRANESVAVADPAAGYYVVFVAPFATPAAGVPYRVVSYVVNPASNVDSSALTVAPNQLSVASGTASSFVVSWANLPPQKQFVALVDYGPYASPTVVSLDSSVANWVPPVISGARVGAVATATSGDWSRSPVTVSYQWTADGAAIANATAPTFAVPAGLLGSRLGVTVTAVSGADPAASVSTSSVVVGTDGEAALNNVTPPTVSGEAQVGQMLRAAPGEWNVPGSTLHFTYQWSSDGIAIPGATEDALTVPTSVAGRNVVVAVTATVGGTGLTAAASSSPVMVANPAPAVIATVPPEVPFVVGPTVAAAISPAIAPAVPKPSKAHSRVTITRSDATITTRVKERVTVRLYVAGGAKQTGTVVLRYGTRSKTVVLHAGNRGKIVVTLPKLKRGHYTVEAQYRGSATVAAATSARKSLTVRR